MDDDVYPSTDARGQLHSHGSSCAGVLAMAKDNNVCGVGVAYNSKVAGIRLLSGLLHTDATEAIALGLNSQHIDIYSNSWGPYDDGIIVDGPGRLALTALEQGVRTVRIWGNAKASHIFLIGQRRERFYLCLGSWKWRGCKGLLQYRWLCFKHLHHSCRLY